jgi:threonine dehydrogenase-like Zn-dependent dehydrogenase
VVTTTVPATMAAAVYRRAGALDVEERPVPVVGPGDVLIEVSHCGICGTDLHFVLEGWGRPDSIPGHEYSGRIVAVGEGVDGDAWPVGTLVVGGPEPACGSCRSCLVGRPSLCDQRDTPGKDAYQGAFARYVLVRYEQLRRVPDGLDARRAALAEPLAVALHAITTSRITAGQTAMVSGAGPIGALIIAALPSFGVTDIVTVEPGASRADLARQLGATGVLDPAALEVPSIAEPEKIVGGAVDAVFECSGKRAAMEAGLAQLRRGGTLVIVGSGIDPPRFDPNRILLNELIVTGSFNYDATGFEDALTLLASGSLPTDLLIDPVDTDLHDIVTAMQRLVAGDIAGKVMVVPHAEGASHVQP